MYKILSIILFTYGLCFTTDDIYDNSWALIIGIDKYENVHKLNYAVDDAESIKDILINSFDFPEENVSLLINEQASKQNIIKSFSTITKNAKSNDRVVVFFAGHGETMDLPGGGEKGYLIPVEGDANDLYVTSIPMDELKQIALMSKAKHMLYLVDACYGGIAAVGSRGLAQEETPTYLKKVTKFQSRQVITAGGRGEKVIEKPEWGHSAFTLNLKRGLKEGAADMNSDGYITANELGMFLTEKVTIDSENQQTPQYGRMTSQEGEFVFVFNDEVSSNKTISNNSDTDEKLDMLLTKLEKLESENEISINKNQLSTMQSIGWYEKYGYRTHGIGFIVNEIETFSISYIFDFDKKYQMTIYYFQGSHDATTQIFNIYKVDIPPSINISGKNIGINIMRRYFINDYVVPNIGLSASRITYLWEDINNNISGKTNSIEVNAFCGLFLSPFKFNKPFPINLGVNFGISLMSMPNSFYFTGDTLISNKKRKAVIAPFFNFVITIPINRSK